ncbi:MAG: transglutaminase domain-containing protein [Chloroflexi bacterium]|nr:transglutaminase domain-containing protein [Chloroflexota bacterium]
MSFSANQILDFYAQPGPVSDPRQYAPLFDDFPADIGELCHTLQGLMVHVHWASRYGLELSEARQQEVCLRSAARKLERLLALDPAPLTSRRPLEKRLVSNCRDFSLMLVTILRHRGIPARARCGFGLYFMPGTYEDHWVVEYWKPVEDRWIMVDAQLDDFQRQHMEITFDPLDMPAGQFITGGKAWLMARLGEADPQKFGIFDIRGMDFIRGNLVRDLLALNKIEILPWDIWGMLTTATDQLPPAGLDWLDGAARSTLAGDREFTRLRSLYAEEPGIHVPEAWLD